MKRAVPAPSSPQGAAAGKPRPGFPARLPAASPAPVPRNPLQARPPAARVSAPPQAPQPKVLPRVSVPVAPTGVGMDSQAVRASMVRKIQGQGVTHIGPEGFHLAVGDFQGAFGGERDQAEIATPVAVANPAQMNPLRLISFPMP